MMREEIVMLCTSDIAGQTRGKGFPASELELRLAKGIGWTPTNIMITAFGAIAPGPWGPFGDLVIKPAPETRVRVDFGPDQAAEHFLMGDLCHLDGAPWEVCPRSFLKRVLKAIETRHGLKVKAAFEHEFTYEAVSERPNSSYALDAFRRQNLFAEVLLGALKGAGLGLDTFMPEYGPMQYEVTVAPALGVTAADQAIAVREITHAVACRLGSRASFTPILRPDAVGNGVHVHMSLIDSKEQPVIYEAGRPGRLSQRGGAFVAGIMRHMQALIALTAPSPVSYLRLQPHSWSSSYTWLGERDREATLRICPPIALGPFGRLPIGRVGVVVIEHILRDWWDHARPTLLLRD